MPSLRSSVGAALLSLLLSSPALANPLPTPAVQAAQDIFNTGVEAVYTPTPAPFHIEAAAIANPPALMTITVINKHIAPVSTYHAHEAGGPTAVWGAAGAGTMAKGATASYALPTGWAGNIAVVEYGGPRNIVGDESLIEANFKKPDGYSVAVADVDVSYVNGFSVPIVCSCVGAGVVTGCNKNLWGLNSCANDNGKGSCKNPLRSDQTATAATPFFKPCQGGAYTYVNDHNANSFGVCQSGRITCCIGTACDRDPKQPN
ncbi:hypothetical protein CONLIGDRAFT_706427 [Coniochaeta ligniaria NRRL 30616]|uniref:Osmotin, thaumatin-like protein n=1 Tax=Coniochaeta ligniaria NRRL 30616 TaxID=1408157 RepID=A0A1J7IG71_9PEZI|nr:hypothetical protein CONLIGDRAFT_706427 [Coniochaeta ligniaria NRRL 30616]